MKQIKLFILNNCPYCKQALQYLNEYQQEEIYKDIVIEKIEEREQKEIADQYDYYYVPSFYIDEKKVHEGAVTKEIVKNILEQARIS